MTAGSTDLCSALEGTRTPNLLIRSQMLYPLSYERLRESSLEAWPALRLPDSCRAGDQVQGPQPPLRWYIT